MTNSPPDPRRSLIAARVLCDIAALVAALSLASVLRFGLGFLAFTEDPDLGATPYLLASLIWVIAVMRALAVRGMYDEDTLVGGRGEASRAWRALLEGVAVLAFIAFLVRGEQLSRSWFLLAALLSAIFLPVVRVILRRIIDRRRAHGSLRRPVVLVSTRGESASISEDHIAEFDIIERVEPAALLTWLEDATATTVLIDSADIDEDLLWELVLAAGQRGASVFLMSQLRALPTERITMRDLAGRTVMRLSPPRIAGLRAVEKRSLDLLVALVLLVPALIIGALVVVVQLLTSGRPIMYRQERLGRDGKVFLMWKFRSMRPDAEHDSGPVWTAKDDPRRTGFGRFLRRSSLDELPQIWNVLRGDMSMVGPRPERPEFVERFSAEMRWYRYRLRIKPGLTGLAQALGFRGLTPLDARLERDNWYIENWSLGLDVQILARTVTAVIKGTNAE